MIGTNMGAYPSSKLGLGRATSWLGPARTEPVFHQLVLARLSILARFWLVKIGSDQTGPKSHSSVSSRANEEPENVTKIYNFHERF